MHHLSLRSIAVYLERLIYQLFPLNSRYRRYGAAAYYQLSSGYSIIEVLRIMQPFVHLHCHSDYSLLSATTRISEMVQRARECGMRHLALTDDGNLFGAVEFWRAAQNAKINPIVGCDFYLAPGARSARESEHRPHYARLVLLARNAEGYRNLVELSSRAYTEGFYYKPRIDDQLLERYHHNLIAFCGGRYGDVGRDIVANRYDQAQERACWYRDLFGSDHFYLELQQHTKEDRDTNDELARLATQLNIPLVATNNCYYTRQEDAQAHEILLCIGRNRKLDRQRSIMPSREFYMKSPQEMWELFSNWPAALENSLCIAEMCNIELSFPGPQLPRYQIPEDFDDANSYLRHLAHQGFRQRYGAAGPAEVQERLEYELDIVTKMGFAGYFLIVWDLVRYAHNHQIPVGPGRGSGAGSVVAYSLQITNIDPIKYGLIFERFLNPERVSMPDFDIDFCYERRSEIIEYITRHYGANHVGQIITFGTLRARAVVRDVARVLGISYSDADQIAKQIPMGIDVTLGDAIKNEPSLQALAKQDELHRELIEISLKLEGLHRHASTHAAGVVIAHDELTKYVPLYRDPKTGVISTQYSMEYLEDCGLVKMDILGLKTLTLIKNSIDLVAAEGEECDIEQIPNDAATFDMLAKGNSGAVFQFENPGMQQLLKRAKPNCIEDLIALTSLYRPGPMDNIDQYIAAKLKSKRVHYPLKLLEEILHETYGVIIYQEQVIEIVQRVAGFTPGQADIMRRAMGKKKSAEMRRMKKNFVEGAQHNDISQEMAEKIFELIIPFAGYGFNKSHAAAYSILAYQTAYLKCHFPRQFMAANLTNEINNNDTFIRYLTETRKMGIKVLAPDVNRSLRHFSVMEGNVIFGLRGIKNIGRAVVEEILRARQDEGLFKNFEDFLARVDTGIVNRRSIEACILAGLFDSFGQYRATLFYNLPRLLKIASERRAMRKSGQQDLFALEKFDALDYERAAEFPHAERMLREREMLGAYFTGHPLDSYRELWEKIHSPNLHEWERWPVNQRYIILGCVISERSFQSKQGNLVTVIQLEDYNGSCEVLVFDIPKDGSLEFVKINDIVGIEVELQKSKRGLSLMAQKFFPPTETEQMISTELHISITANDRGSAHDNTLEEALRNLRDILLSHRGDSQVLLHLPSHLSPNGVAQSLPSPSLNGNTNSHPVAHPATEEVVIRVSSDLRVGIDPKMIAHLEDHPMVAKVWSN